MLHRFFIDETGDHNLTKLDKTYPIFALGGLCVSDAEYSKLDEFIVSIKRKYFDAEDIILHSSELKRPKDERTDPRNIVMLDPEVRARFYKEFDDFLEHDNSLSITACFIHKELHASYYTHPTDPYHLSFENILNRVLWHADSVIEITAECRGKELDAALLAEYERLRTVGSRFHPAEDIRKRTTLSCVPKSDNVNGLQMIDLVMSCLTRHYLGKTEKMVGNDLAPRLLEKKYMQKSPTFFPKRRKG